MENNTAPAKPSFLADTPLEHPKDDKLGRATFAETLAEAIVEMSAADGFVLALYGAWGSGKSTTLNFVLHYIDQYPHESQPIVVRFNPWWFSGSEQILRAFFAQLRSTLRSGEGATFEQVGEALEKYAGLVAPVLSLIPGAGQAAGQFLVAVRDVFSGEVDLEKARSELDALLRQQGRRLLVVMDDIDRLTAAEIRQMFQLVKAVADFPNTIYLLAFDDEVVAAALEGIQGGSGKDYLDKIVQAPFHLPLPDRYALRRVLFDHLDKVFVDVSPGEIDETRWSNVLLDGIIPFIRTVRDVKRYVNILAAVWPVVKGEVDIVDFLGIEALRLFVPELYVIVRDNKSVFAGAEPPTPEPGMTPDERKERYEQFLEQVNEADKEAAHELLRHLFPKFGRAFGHTVFGPNWEWRWRRELLVRSADIFDTYFRLSVPEGAISAVEMRATLSSGSDNAAFARELRRLAGERGPGSYTSRARVFLERIQDHTEQDIPIEDIQPVLQALYDVGDELVALNDSGGFFDPFGNEIHIMRVTYQLLQRIADPNERFTMIKSIIQRTPSVWCAVEVVSWFEHEHDKDRRQETILRAEHVDALRTVALSRIQHGAEDSYLRTLGHVGRVLHYWRKWGGRRASATIRG